MRLDDASEHMNIKNWLKMKELLDRYGIKPIYGIIPKIQDPDILEYEKVPEFWQLMRKWQEEGYIPALHGYTHVFETEDSGMNPVNMKSEFAGLSLERQREKIREGYKVLIEHDIRPDIFIAPAHTFDMNTLKALYEETPIRVISDTVASDVYYHKPFYFIPQQSGRVRKLPFKTVTFCYHPNTMAEIEFEKLQIFIECNIQKWEIINISSIKKRRKSMLDNTLSMIYFLRRYIL